MQVRCVRIESPIRARAAQPISPQVDELRAGEPLALVRADFEPPVDMIGAGKEALVKVAVVGSGTVGTTLADGAIRAGFEVRTGSRRSGAEHSVQDVLAWADATLLAIPGDAVEEFASANSEWLAGSVVVDATNNFGAVTLSGVQTIVSAAPSARVFRAFNSVGWENMTVTEYDGIRPDMFFAGPDDDSRSTVSALIDGLGPRPVYVGATEQAYAAVDALVGLWAALAFDQGHGRKITFKLLGA